MTKPDAAQRRPKAAIHMVSAFIARRRLVRGQMTTALVRTRLNHKITAKNVKYKTIYRYISDILKNETK
jgi:hypothetical protein